MYLTTQEIGALFTYKYSWAGGRARTLSRDIATRLFVSSSTREDRMSKAKLLACLVGASVSCLLAVAAQSADETYTVKTIIPVPGGLTSFDIAFVDANIRTFVLADRTNKSIDVVDTSTNIMTHQYTATPPFIGVVASPPNASGPNGVIIVDQREIWATDAPVLSCSGSPQVCTVVGGQTSSIKVLDFAG